MFDTYRSHKITRFSSQRTVDMNYTPSCKITNKAGEHGNSLSNSKHTMLMAAHSK